MYLFIYLFTGTSVLVLSSTSWHPRRQGLPHHGILDVRYIEEHQEIDHCVVVVVADRRRSFLSLSSSPTPPRPRQPSPWDVEQSARKIEPGGRPVSAAAGFLVDGRRGRADAVDVPAMGDHSRTNSFADAAQVRRRVGRHAVAVVVQPAATISLRRCPVFLDVGIQHISVQRCRMPPAGVADVSS